MSIEQKIQIALGAGIVQQLVLSEQIDAAAQQTVVLYKVLDAFIDEKAFPTDARNALLTTAYGKWYAAKKEETVPLAQNE
jgi:hypothetical protein